MFKDLPKLPSAHFTFNFALLSSSYSLQPNCTPSDLYTPSLSSLPLHLPFPYARSSPPSRTWHQHHCLHTTLFVSPLHHTILLPQQQKHRRILGVKSLLATFQSILSLRWTEHTPFLAVSQFGIHLQSVLSGQCHLLICVVPHVCLHIAVSNACFFQMHEFIFFLSAFLKYGFLASFQTEFLDISQLSFIHDLGPKGM